ncbi:PREDICTED: pentraxin-4 [Chrysochloris asiatica]|uniref:Pentraxin-4 n=1 Tax=Chrysochloris asiatica TaxID=185453 RepID=A0A9B0WZQ8_CHRAS|nr:PREDICTED: pentraxin-4 [Chrysochloris asiatica]
MGCPGSRTLCFLLMLAPAYFHSTSSQEASLLGQRRPFFERLRRLEEQFQRFQEVTLTHLQGIASNYNVSYNIDARFRSLALENQAVAQALNQSQATVQADLSHLKTSVRKAQRRSRKVDAKLLVLDQVLSEGNRQHAVEHKEQKVQSDAASSLAQNLALDVRILQDMLANLTELVHSQGVRLAALEGHLQAARSDPAAPSPTPPQWLSPSSLQLQRLRQAPQALLEHRSPPRDVISHLRATQGPAGTAPGDTPLLTRSPQRPGEICNVGPALVFPNASTENAVFLRRGFLSGLRALSVCSWVRTSPGRLGTLLSYATEDNDNKVVLHGRDSLAPGSVHFVIGDPAFRELPLQPLLDGRWHHVCVIWTSFQGRHWLYVDRRLVATGSRFREDYEIPPGGSLVLGQEQDTVGGGFDSAEAFVGSVAGLAIWGRPLTPREVSSLATGKSVPTGALLTLANATSVGGFVQLVTCSCLEHCP